MTLDKGVLLIVIYLSIKNPHRYRQRRRRNTCVPYHEYGRNKSSRLSKCSKQTQHTWALQLSHSTWVATVNLLEESLAPGAVFDPVLLLRSL